MMFLHVLDHPRRSRAMPSVTKRYIENPYLTGPQPKELFDLGASSEGSTPP